MLSFMLVSSRATGGNSHCAQRHDGVIPPRLAPIGPAFGVKPCMRRRLGPERQHHRAGRLAIAAETAILVLPPV